MLKEVLESYSYKNRCDFVRAKKRLNAGDNDFYIRVHTMKNIIEYKMDTIIDALKDFFNTQNITLLVGKKFNEKMIRSFLKDMYFIAFLVQSNLAYRFINLTKESKSGVKVRIYFAILDYEQYID